METSSHRRSRGSNIYLRQLQVRNGITLGTTCAMAAGCGEFVNAASKFIGAHEHPIPRYELEEEFGLLEWKCLHRSDSVGTYQLYGHIRRLFGQIQSGQALRLIKRNDGAGTNDYVIDEFLRKTHS